jgi:hypothetical protein
VLPQHIAAVGGGDSAFDGSLTPLAEWLLLKPRSSWINQVERWFGYLTDQMIRRGAHKNVQSLEKQIHSAVATNVHRVW